jgi:hypothetical protein
MQWFFRNPSTSQSMQRYSSSTSVASVLLFGWLLVHKNELVSPHQECFVEMHISADDHDCHSSIFVQSLNINSAIAWVLV